jgi:hypothetical protein
LTNDYGNIEVNYLKSAFHGPASLTAFSLVRKVLPQGKDGTWRQGALPDVIDLPQHLNHRTRQLHYFTGLWAVILLGAAVLWGGQPTPARAAGTEPRATIIETSFDFGKIYEDRTLTHTFMIENSGAAPLTVEDVDPDCACTVASYDKTILPGGQGAITLTIKPFSVIHQFKKETKVRLNAPERPMLHLVMTGMALPFIEIQPSHIVRLRGTPGEDVKGQVHFISHLPDPWEITQYRTTMPEKIAVSLKPEVPGKEYVLEVRNKSREAGPYAGLVELFTTSKERPRLIVRVFGDLYLPSAGGQ